MKRFELLFVVLAAWAGTGCAHYHAFGGGEGAKSMAYAPERMWGDHFMVVVNAWGPGTVVRVSLNGVVVHDGVSYGADAVRIVLPIDVDRRRNSYRRYYRELPTTSIISVQVVDEKGEPIATQCRSVTVGGYSSYRSGSGAMMWVVEPTAPQQTAGERRSIYESYRSASERRQGAASSDCPVIRPARY